MTKTNDDREARLLIRRGAEASLATIFAGAAPMPYASLVSIASDVDGSPLLLLSNLAEHTKNLQADARASILFASAPEPGEDPLARARVTLLGRLEATAEPRHRERFLARHPEASFYAGFADFRFYRMAIERAHLVAGFGKIRWVETPSFLAPGADEIAAVAPEIVAHMNRDHADAVGLCAQTLLGRNADEPWRMAAIDPDGCDLVAGQASVYLEFAAPVTDAQSARAELVRLTNLARENGGKC